MGKRASVLKYIEALWEKYNFGLIVMESARLYTGGKNVPLVSIEAIISLSTTIEDWAQRTGNAGVVKVATNSWRKVVLGDGRAQKKDAQVYVLHHFRKDLNEDAAEAICQAVYGVKTWQP
jgi:Holliday junction resolvasome RuvABC endonuclease subunit